MAVFEYTAKDEAGNKFSGVYTDVDSISDLRGELAKMGYSVIKARKGQRSRAGGGGKVKQDDVVAMAYEFAGMYSAGLSIVRCLETLDSQCENAVLKSILQDIKEHVETGWTLKEAFERHRTVFSDFFIGMLEAGEAGGKLAETLQMAADYLETQADLKRKVKGAFAYPIVVCIMCLLIVSALVLFVIPVFQKLYNQLHVSLPLPTLVLVAVSEGVRQYWWLILAVVGTAVFVIRKLIKKPSVKAKIDCWKLSLPVFGKLNRMVLVSRFMRTFSMMASAGVSLVDSLELARQVGNNSEMDKISKAIQERIITGSSFAGPLSEFTIFPPIIIQLAASGEEAGILPEMVAKGVDFLDKQIDRMVKSLLIKIEPIMSVIMGAIVGSILLGVYLPMFDYMSHIK